MKMKRSSELIGMSVVSIEDGREVGKIREIVLNPKKAEIMALAIEDEKWYKEVKIISFPLIYGIGEYAVTVENASSLVSLSSMPDVEELLEKKIRAKGAKTITKSGKLIGEISEYFVDTKKGKIISYEITVEGLQQGETKVIPATSVITIGEDVVVVSDEVDKSVQQKVEELTLEEEKPEEKEEIEEEKIEIEKEEVKTEKKEDIAELLKDVEEVKEEPKKEEVKQEPPKKGVDLSKIFEERQKKFILGKKASRKIDNIVEEGEIITEEVIEKAKARGKFMELSMSIKME